MTGAAGYVGGRLIRELETRSIPVRAIVRERREWLGSHEQFVADLTQASGLTEVCAGAAAIVHLAGPNEVVASADPDGTIEATVEGTRRIARAAAASSVPRLIYLSTMHVYGSALLPGALVDETTPPLPNHPYAIARLESEHVVEAARSELVVPVILRLTNSVGAPAHPSVARWSLVVNDLCRQAVVNGRLTLRSDGTQWRDFIALADVCGIIGDVASGELAPGVYNLGRGVPVTVRDVAELVQSVATEVLGVRPPMDVPEPAGPPAEPYRIVVDKLAAAGHRPMGSIAGAIEETLRFCVEWKDTLAR